MELPHPSAASNEFSPDKPEKKDDKKSKKRVPYIPLPFNAEARAQEARQNMQEQLADSEKSKRKRKKDAKDQAPLIPPAPEEYEDDTVDLTKKPERTDKPTDEAIDVLHAQSPDGELAISNRAQKKADSAETIAAMNVEQPELDKETDEDDDEDDEASSVQGSKKSAQKQVSGAAKPYTQKEPVTDSSATVPKSAEVVSEERSEQESDKTQAVEQPSVEDYERASKEALVDEEPETEAETVNEDETDPFTQTPAPQRNPNMPLPPPPSFANSNPNRSRAMPPPPAVPPPIFPGGFGYPNPNTPSFNIPPQTPNVAPVWNPNIAPQPVAAASVERGRRSAEGAHLVAGLLIGGLIEHIRHTKREKKQEKQHVTDIRGLNEKLSATEATHTRRQTALEQQIERLKESAARRSAERSAAVPVAAIRPEQNPLIRQEAATAGVASPAEAIAAKQQEEDRKVMEARKKLEQAWSEDEETPDEPFEIPPEHRMASSAWHHIEVDRRTGKAVENPTFSYGKEFQNEQHQELIRRELEEDNMPGYVQGQDGSSSQSRYGSIGGGAGWQQGAQSNRRPSKGSPVSMPSQDSKVIDVVLALILIAIVIVIIRVLSP